MKDGTQVGFAAALVKGSQGGIFQGKDSETRQQGIGQGDGAALGPWVGELLKTRVQERDQSVPRKMLRTTCR
jgi:hypothetical protein